MLAEKQVDDWKKIDSQNQGHLAFEIQDLYLSDITLPSG